MFRHKFLLFAILIGLFAFGGCSSSSSSNDGNGTIPDKNETTCEAPQVLENGECVTPEVPITCEEGEELQDGVCVTPDTPVTCEEGEELQDGVCVTPEVPITCEEGEELQDGVCVTPEVPITCEEGEELQDGVCITTADCEVGEVWNGETLTCEVQEVKTLKYLYISGVAIDGALKEAAAQLINKTTGEVISSAKTTKDGKWAFGRSADTDADDVDTYVKVKGGIDTATGKPFEGMLENVIDKDDITEVTYSSDDAEPEIENPKTVLVSPVTTLMSSIMKKNPSMSKSDAVKKTAKVLNISEDTVTKNPIDTLESGSNEEKEAAAEAIKKAMMIQKAAESLAKSVSDEDDEDSFDRAFAAVFHAVAEKSDSDEEIDLGAVLEEDTFVDSIVTNIGDSEKAEETKAKLKAASKSVSQATKVLEKIDVKTINIDTLEVVAKSAEIVTDNLEAKIVAIAKAETTEDIENAGAEAEKVTNAVTAMGGIEAISQEVAKVVEEAKTQAESEVADETEEVEASVDIDKISILTEEVTEQYSEVYTKLEEAGVSPDTILDSSIEASKNEIDLVVVVAEKVETDGGDTTNLDAIASDIQTAVDEAKTKIEEAVTVATESAVIVVVVKKVAPEISITNPPTKGYVGETYKFVVSISNKLELENVTISWSTGGNLSSTSTSFDSVGSYPVKVTVTGNGQSVSKTVTITIIENPEVVTCGADEVLENGVCVAKPDETPVTCTEDQVLENGVCVAKPDETPITCNEDQVLENGVCVAKPDENEPVTCTENQVLENGVCVAKPDETPVSSLDVSLTASYLNPYVGTVVKFTATQIAGATYSWNIGGTAQVVNKSFTTSGTKIVSVTVSKDGQSVTKSITITVKSYPTSGGGTTPTDYDKLAIKLNKATFGADGFEKIIAVENGNFATIKYPPFVSFTDAEREQMFKINFNVENVSFENSDEETVVLGIKVEDLNSSRAVMMIGTGLTLSYNTTFNLEDTNSTELYGYYVKESGSSAMSSVDLANINLSDYLSVVENNATLNYVALIQKAEEQIANSDNLVEKYFTQSGAFKVSIYISGVDGFNGMKDISDSELTASFSGDYATSIADKFGTTFGVVGNIEVAEIGQIGDITAKIASESDEVQTYDVSSYFSDAIDPTYTLECDPSDGDITISNSGVITVDTENSGSYNCEVTFDDGYNIETSEIFTISVIDNLDPIFVTDISDLSLMVDTEMESVATDFVDPESDPLTYTLNCTVDGVAIDAQGVVSGTPTEVSDATTCTVTATDEIGQSADSNEFTITVSALPTPEVTLDASTNSTDSSTEVTFTATATVSNDANISYEWFVNSVSYGTGIDTFSYTFDMASSDPVETNHTVKVVATANENSAEATTVVTISNAQPTAEIIYSGSCEVNTTCTFEANVTDADTSDTHTYSWVLDGSVVGSNATLEHNFTAEGTYTLELNVSDDGGATGSDSVDVEAKAGLKFGDTNITLDASEKTIENVDVKGIGGYTNSDIIISFNKKDVSTPTQSGNVIAIAVDGDDTNFIIKPDDIYDGNIFIIYNKSDKNYQEVTYDKDNMTFLNF
jgi:PKD repeat protein